MKTDDEDGDAANIRDVYDYIATEEIVCMNVEVLPYEFKEGYSDSTNSLVLVRCTLQSREGSYDCDYGDIYVDPGVAGMHGAIYWPA